MDYPQTETGIKVLHYSLTRQTSRAYEIIDITEEVEKLLAESGVVNGQVNIFVRHTTATIKINEREDGFFRDFEKFCQSFVPAGCNYHHDDLESRDPATLCDGEECLNGHSHLLQMFVGTASETIPVIDGTMQLGKWQRIFLVELDRAKEREVLLTVMGQ